MDLGGISSETGPLLSSPRVEARMSRRQGTCLAQGVLSSWRPKPGGLLLTLDVNSVGIPSVARQRQRPQLVPLG